MVCVSSAAEAWLELPVSRLAWDDGGVRVSSRMGLTGGGGVGGGEAGW
jgi:hypothetical protein